MRSQFISHTEYALKWQRWRCYLCAKQMTLQTNRLRTVTEDHIIPRVKGGSRTGNIALACRECNSRKGPRPPTACERLFGTLMREAYDIDDYFRHAVWLAYNIQKTVDRRFHGQATMPLRRGDYPPTV